MNNVSFIISLNANTSNAPQGGFKQVKQDFKQLATSLQSGDLAGAKQAFDSLQQSGVFKANANSPVGNDVSNLSKALDSGNLSDAQSAFASLKQDIQVQRQNNASSAPQNPPLAPPPQSGGSSNSSTVNTSQYETYINADGDTISLATGLVIIPAHGDGRKGLPDPDSDKLGASTPSSNGTGTALFDIQQQKLAQNYSPSS
jgi:hypothetical protein